MTQAEDNHDKDLLRKTLRGDLGSQTTQGYRLTYQADLKNNRWYVYTSGGFYLLYKWENSTTIMNMDWGAMIGDENIVHLRNLVIEVFEEMGRSLVPFSIRASERGVANYRTSTVLVERVGWECVFTTAVNNVDQTLRYYLSGYDQQEAPPLYFLTELPHGVNSVAAARQALKPPSVIAAEAEGLEVVRQGDMFAIPTKLTRADILKMGGVIKEWDDNPNVIYRDKSRPLYGTAHTATKVATLPDGTHLAKGKLLHRPHIIGEGRQADHRDRDLPGRMWYVITKNTTPIDRPRRR